MLVFVFVAPSLFLIDDTKVREVVSLAKDKNGRLLSKNLTLQKLKTWLFVLKFFKIVYFYSKTQRFFEC